MKDGMDELPNQLFEVGHFQDGAGGAILLKNVETSTTRIGGVNFQENQWYQERFVKYCRLFPA